LVVFCTLILALVSVTSAQQTATKRPLTHNDYDSWKSIQSQKLSREGKFLAYALTPEDGDAELVVHNLATGTEWRSGIGTRAAQTATADETGVAAAPAAGAQAPQIFFTHDARFVAFKIDPSKADVDKAKKDKKKPEDQPKAALGLMSLADGKVTTLDRVKSFEVPEDADGFIAYLKEAPPDAATTPSTAANNPSTNRGASRNRKEYGTDLVLRTLSDQNERTFNDVLEYSLSRDAKTLVYAVSSRKEDSEGLYAFIPGGSSPTPLLNGKGKYTKISWDEKQTQLVFLSDRDDVSSNQPKLKLYHWDRRASKADEIASNSTPNFRSGMVISDRGAISFSLDGSKVFFGVAPPQEPEKDSAVDSAAIDDDKPSFDLWSWKDDFIQPMQKVRANQERNRSFRAEYNFANSRFLQLADETMENLTPSSDGRLALGADDRPYRQLVGVDTNYSDYYIVNTDDGSRKPLAKKQNGQMTWSPNGRYALFYHDKNWFSVSMPEGKITNLTQNLGVDFWQEEYDSPSAPPSYGNAGWTRDDKYVLLNDRYDIWQVAADGSNARNLTGGVGRKGKIVFRYVRLEPQEPGQERGIDPAKPLLLSAVNESTRDEGFYRGRIEGTMPEKLHMAAKAFHNPVKAKDADVVMLTESTFDEFPDIMITNSDFSTLNKVTNANPQKGQLLWGTAELIHYKNADGVPLSGILLKPENFDPSKKYPMIVYIYERLTQNLNSFVDPRPSHTINASYYVSNGYLVLEPDIVYTIGYPGQSALKCVLPAVQAVVDKGFVNENAIGIEGHSWGGYQIAYMVTQTNRFKAAAPGAVVANMTSAYSGVRWGTGLPRQFQYEHTQSRIGGNLWEYPMRFVENSPLFQLDRVQTPILTIHNDGDDAVPWYQGIEFYLGLRRLGKEVYMFSYNGEPHGLRRRPNQKDYSVRLQQFFDHFLKGAPAPDWMMKGIPFLQKGKESGTGITARSSKSAGPE
jgi:dipeptidyl aminopeptidase/acylaminoacyl peptidase